MSSCGIAFDNFIFHVFSDMRCQFIPEFHENSWRQSYSMDPYVLINFASSMAGDNDIWLSGGISLFFRDNNFPFKWEVSIVSKVNVMKNKTFVIEDGPELPKPLAGHCQVFIGDGQVFIYGGITAIGFNETLNGIEQIFKYSNQAYLWRDESWLTIPHKNPCSNDMQDLAFQQPCTQRIVSNQSQIVIETFSKRTSCTSILNLNTYHWSMLNDAGVNIPIGGHLVTSSDKSRVFSLGGLYYAPEEIQSLDVYELGSNGWEMIEAKLPYGISSNETKSYPSSHNVTINV